MVAIAALQIELAANVARLQSDLAKGRAEFRKFGKGVQSDIGGIKSVFDILKTGLGAFGIGLSVASIVGFTKRTVDAAGGLKDLSQQLGIGTDALQGLQFAAAQSNVGADQLDAGLRNLTRTIGDAATGSKTAAQTFVALGVSFKDSSGRARSTEDVLSDVIDRYKSLKNPAEQAAAAQNLFGKSGQVLLPIIADQSKSLTQFISIAKDAGAVLTEEMITQAKDASDKWAALDFTISKLSQTIASKYAPALTEMLDKLTKIAQTKPPEGVGDWVKWFRDLDQALPGPLSGITLPFTGKDLALDMGPNRPPPIPPFGGGGGRGAPSGTMAGNKPLGNLDIAAAQKIQTVIDNLKLESDQLKRTAKEREIYAELKKADISISTADGKAIADLTSKLHDETQAFEAAKAVRELDTGFAEQMDADAQSARDRGKALVNSQIEITAGFQKQISDNESLIGALDNGSKAYELQAEKLDILNKFRAAGMPLVGDEIQLADDLAATLVDQARVLDSLKAANDDLAGSMQTLADGFAAATEGSIDWQKITLAGIDIVSDAIIKMSKLDTGGKGGIGGLLSGLLDLGLSALGGAAGGGGIGAPVRFGGAFAGGGEGMVSKPTLFLAGEAGTEHFKFTPHADMLNDSSEGGKSLNVVINAPGADAEQLRRVRRSVDDLNRTFERRVDSRVIDQKRRGGKYADAFA